MKIWWRWKHMIRRPDEISQLEQYVMLAILHQQPSAYGVSLQQYIREQTDRDYSMGAVYAALDRLEGKGYVSAKQGEPTAERGGRAKLYFHLTAPGQQTLQQSLRAVDQMRRAVGWTEVLT